MIQGSDADFRKQLRESEETRIKLLNLVESAGWKLFEAYVKRDAEAALAMSRGAALEPTEALRILTAYNVAMRLVEWPAKAIREGEEFRKAVEEHLANQQFHT